MERTFVLSPAAVRYWLPPLQLAGHLVERFCCDPVHSLRPNYPKGGKNKIALGAMLFEEVVRMLRDSLCQVSDEKLRGLSERFSRVFHAIGIEVKSILSSGQSPAITADAAERASASMGEATTPARKGRTAGQKTGGARKARKESNVKKAIQAGKIGEAPPAEAVKTEATPASAPKGEGKGVVRSTDRLSSKIRSWVRQISRPLSNTVADSRRATIATCICGVFRSGLALTPNLTRK